MKTQTIVVGVDGGGSKTRAVVANDKADHLAEASGVGSAVHPERIEESAGVIAGVAKDALELAEKRHIRPRVLYVGVAGVGRERPRQDLQEALVAHNLADAVIVQPDFTVALDDAFSDGTGVVLIAGTGSSAFGRGPAGTSMRCGGWGAAIGDEGGGAWIGRRALSVVAAASDGREPETALTGAVLTALDMREAVQLIPWAASATPAMLATLAPVVLDVAAAGDLRANAIVSMAVEELALHVRAIARKLFVDERASVPIALSGGLFAQGSAFRKRFEHRLKSAAPGAQVHSGDIDPARGAVRAALRFLSRQTA